MDDGKKPRTTCETVIISNGAGRLNGSILNGGRQRMSLRDQELSQLENEIKKAYVLKGLHAQLAEQEADQMAADIQTRIADEILRYRVDAENEARDRIEESERHQRTIELQTVLKRQVDEKRVERCLLEEEERRERKLLVEVDRVREEREEYERMRNKEELAEQLILENLVQREIRQIDKCKLKELEMEESVKNQKYLEELDERAKRLKKMRLDAQKKRDEVTLNVAKMLLELQCERNERQRLLSDLMIEEVKFDAEVEAREAQLRRQQEMRNFAEDLKAQIQFEEECRRRFLEREQEFADSIMAKIMESEKMERLSAEVRRRRRLEYRQELDKLMKERERIRAEELSRLRITLEKENRREEIEKEEARKARMTLLEQHIDNIADFMSRKSLYDQERGVVDGSRKKK